MVFRNTKTRSLRDPLRFCHLRLNCSRNGTRKSRMLLGQAPFDTLLTLRLNRRGKLAQLRRRAHSLVVMARSIGSAFRSLNLVRALPRWSATKRTATECGLSYSSAISSLGRWCRASYRRRTAGLSFRLTWSIILCLEGRLARPAVR